jgi:acyl carrier protein
LYSIQNVWLILLFHADTEGDEIMLDRADMTSRLVEIVRQVMPEKSALVSLAGETDLYGAGLTSMAMVKLMLAVEVEFDVSIPDEDLHPDNFRSIEAVEALVGRLKRS